jgi:hypothetical protein
LPVVETLNGWRKMCNFEILDYSGVVIGYIGVLKGL